MLRISRKMVLAVYLLLASSVTGIIKYYIYIPCSGINIYRIDKCWLWRMSAGFPGELRPEKASFHSPCRLDRTASTFAADLFITSDGSSPPPLASTRNSLNNLIYSLYFIFYFLFIIIIYLLFIIQFIFTTIYEIFILKGKYRSNWKSLPGHCC